MPAGIRLIRRSLMAAIALGAALAHGQSPPAACGSPEFAQFDFWLGDWDVRGPAGRLAGKNRITKEIGGCVVHERYDTGQGYRGESLNVYDAGRKVWHQTWVDNAGLVLLLEGGLREGSMVLSGETVHAGGAKTRHRITWTPQADGSVRQFWESTNAAGVWEVAFDGRYTRSQAP